MRQKKERAETISGPIEFIRDIDIIVDMIEKTDTASKKKKILVAEDEAPMARALQMKLQGAGFDADIAKNGQEAIEKIKACKYSAILLDLMMPLVNGFEVLQYIKENCKEIPVVVITNLSQEEDEQKAKDLGVVGFFVKSDTPITDIVKRVVEVTK